MSNALYRGVFGYLTPMEEARLVKKNLLCERVPRKTSPSISDANAVTGSEYGVCVCSTAKMLTEWQLLERNPSRYAKLLTAVQIEALVYAVLGLKPCRDYGREDMVYIRLSGRLDARTWSRPERPALIEFVGNRINLTPLGRAVGELFVCKVPTVRIVQ